jgi:uncharacterized protein with FMN-binding domain
MRRAIITLGSTVAGVAALLSFKTHSVADASAAVTGGATSPSAASTPAAASSPTIASKHKTGSQQKSTSSPTAASSPRAASSPTAASSPASGSTTTRTVTGTVANTPYGPMQVQLVLTGKQITKVNVLQHTDDGSMSVQIDSFALPKLTSETLTAQSARIDAVSGATYTSQGYMQSLQSAVDGA